MQEEIVYFVSALKVIKVDKTSNNRRVQEEHAKMYTQTLVKMVLGSTGQDSITMAFPDFGNLLAHAAIVMEFDKLLEVPIKDTKIKAWAVGP